MLLYDEDMLIIGRNSSRIAKLKNNLNKSFAMKDLGLAKHILGIRISRDRRAKKLFMSQEQCIEKVLQRFKMDKAKVVSSLLATYFKLTIQQSPITDEERKDMHKVPYS